MKHTLTKISHERHSLDGKVLETRSYLPHDLMHFAFANITRSNEGFFRGKENEQREELIVGMLQGAYKEFALAGESFLASEFLERARSYMKEMGSESLSLTEEELFKVFKEYEYMGKRWRNLRTGESIVIDLS